MRTLKAVIMGFIVASALILAGGWAFAALAAPEWHSPESVPTSITGIIGLLITGIAIVAGAYAATRVDDSNSTLSAFIVIQAFFGFGLVREFWSVGSSWYAVGAILLVIPCAMIGRTLAIRPRIRTAT
jgi:uncharacterized membrane protein